MEGLLALCVQALALLDSKLRLNVWQKSHSICPLLQIGQMGLSTALAVRCFYLLGRFFFFFLHSRKLSVKEGRKKGSVWYRSHITKQVMSDACRSYADKMKKKMWWDLNTLRWGFLEIAQLSAAVTYTQRAEKSKGVHLTWTTAVLLLNFPPMEFMRGFVYRKFCWNTSGNIKGRFGV